MAELNRAPQALSSPKLLHMITPDRMYTCEQDTVSCSRSRILLDPALADTHSPRERKSRK